MKILLAQGLARFFILAGMLSSFTATAHGGETENLIINGDLEEDFIETKSGDLLPFGWEIFETRPEEDSTIGPAMENGPSGEDSSVAVGELTSIGVPGQHGCQ